MELEGEGKGEGEDGRTTSDRSGPCTGIVRGKTEKKGREANQKGK
jgi:hypothetical protein